MSSKFSRQARIQPTPIICKKGPPPTDIFEAPGNLTPLQAYVSWNEKLPYANLNFGTRLSLQPLSPLFQWYGISPDSRHQLALYLEKISVTNEWNLSIDRWQWGYLQQTWNKYNIGLRSLAPFQTELIQFVPPTTDYAITAWVAV